VFSLLRENMKSFVALYRGETVTSARLLAVSADPQLVAHVAGHLIKANDASADPALEKLSRGTRGALRVVRDEAQAEPPAGEVLRLLEADGPTARPPQDRSPDRGLDSPGEGR
jgi:hypothetical protein